MTSCIRALVVVAIWLLPHSALRADNHSELPEPTITRSTFAPLPLQPLQSRAESSDRSPASPARSSTAPLITMASSLAIVLGLFAALVWVSRRASKNSTSNRELSEEALCILGKKSLGASGSIAMIRCGRSILIVGIHASGMQRLGEIDDEEEVRRLEAICRGQSKASFDETMAEMQREPIKRGFVGEDIQRSPAAQRHKLFTTS